MTVLDSISGARLRSAGTAVCTIPRDSQGAYNGGSFGCPESAGEFTASVQLGCSGDICFNR